MITQLSEENPKIPSNILHALQAIKPSQLMDQDLWNFRQLENELVNANAQSDETIFSNEEFISYD